MIRHKALCLIFINLLFFLTGCWDRTELNDLAIELGWGLDQAKNNGIQVSAQFIIPSKLGMAQGDGGNKGTTFFVETGTGKDTLEAAQNMQTKLSREIFRGHRRVLVIGEQLARRGLSHVLDTYSRDPEIRLRTDAFIIKGNSAKQFLKAAYPLENIPAMGALKEHTQLGGMGDSAFLNFFIAAMSDGMTPILPVIALNEKKQTSTKGFQIVGIALFNQDLKMVGFLNVNEDKSFLWLTNRLRKQTITATMPQGNASLYMTKMKSKIKPIIHGHTVKYEIFLSGEGSIRENNTDLDLTNSKNITFLEHALEKKAENETLQSIKKVQKQYGTDIFGFGEAIHQRYPSQWKLIKNNWAKQFQNAQVSIHANLTIRRVGLTGPSLQLKKIK